MENHPETSAIHGSDAVQRKIIHVDMDAFYASVEIRDNPSLEGHSVVVGGSPESRSVVCAASYPARKFGIHSAMPCARAKRLCPETVFLKPRFDRYRETSQAIHRIFQKYTDIIEPLSLDEAWLDVTQNHIDCPSATWVAEKIRTDIRQTLNLKASAGVSYNKFLAKIASDENKPDGLFVITPENAEDFLRAISVRKLPGVGKVTAQKLKLFGIESGEQLMEKPVEFLVQHFGKLGSYLYQIIRGVDERPVVTHHERKSVGIENTFSEDYRYGEALKKELDHLLSGLFKRLEKHGKQGKTIGLKVKFSDFKQVTRSVTPNQTALTKELIAELSYRKLLEVCRRDFPDRSVRLLGLSISNFEKKSVTQNKDAQQLDMYYFLNHEVSW